MAMWLAYLFGIIAAFWRGYRMEVSLRPLVKIAQVAAVLFGLLFFGCLANTVSSSSPATLPHPEFEMGKIELGTNQPPDGSKIQIDFPVERDLRNIGSRVDGKGMCVTTGFEMAADQSGLEVLKGFRDWCAKEPGGCTPPKFHDQLRRYCAMKGVEVPRYLFYIGSDPEILKLALKSGRMPAITYFGFDGVQYKSRIAHVNNMVHFSNNLAGVYDNNYDRNKRIWMSEKEFIKRWATDGAGWGIILLDAPPPPALAKRS